MKHFHALQHLDMMYSSNDWCWILQDRESPEVQGRLSQIDKRYNELIELSKLRKQRLEDAAALYQLYNEADGTEQWIAEKVKTGE